MIQAGTILKSSEELNDTFFENAEIILTQNDVNGAIGFVINKLFPRKLNELIEFRDSVPFPLYEGGPVAMESLYFIHRRPDFIESGIRFAKGLYYGGDFNQAVAQINNGALTESDIKIFIGYCGWDANELEAEVEEGSWKILSNNSLIEDVLK
jgi:putative transcriptional regulator